VDECKPLVMGTLYKDMKLKPIILDEYNKQAGLGSEVGANKFVADDDFIVLEAGAYTRSR
jgi:DNA polymerase delta subunit 2